MPFIPVPQAVEARLRFTLGTAEEANCVLHYRNVDGTPIDAQSADQLAQAIDDAYDGGGLISAIHESCVLRDITVKDISQADQPVFYYDAQRAGEEDTMAALPFQIALCATLRTAVGSRSGRGRVFWPGFSTLDTSDTDPGVAFGGPVLGLKGFMESIMVITLGVPYDGNVFRLGVVSRHAHVGGDADGVAIPPVIRDVEQVTVNRRWDSQRRRANKIRA